MFYAYRQKLKTALKPLLNWILVAGVLYGMGIVAGAAMPDKFSYLDKFFDAFITPFRDLGAAAFIFKIFLHNAVATYLVMCLITGFGIIPAAAALFNGVALGWLSVSFPGLSMSSLAGMIVPHGIFEWPAMMIAWGCGMWKGLGTFGSAVPTTFKQRWSASNRLYVLAVMPLLFMAAIVEGRAHIIQAIMQL